ncbi:MAG: CDC48 family AAA ATPase [Candidatus Altiarchaeota archaeon]|nr:CDC48 family AAA ATPase [Candidatus Altiarchaeota archaeon]
MSDKTKQIRLEVSEAEYADVGRSIARIDSSTMEQLNVNTGDIIEIRGEKKTAAVVWRCRLDDAGSGIIRMDGIIRRNASVSLGDFVEISKAVSAPAKLIKMAPMDHVFLKGNLAVYVKQRMLNKAVLKGDIVVFEVMGQQIPYVVVQTTPKDIVQITAETKFQISDKPVKPGETLSVPTVRYEDIGGLKEEIKKIREMVELPLKHPILFQKLGIEPPKGVLLHGPPGTGKTLLAKAVANESDANFITINGPEIMSKFYGESEKKIREVFDEAEKNAPSIVFLDELDAIAPKREEVSGELERRIVSQLLTLLDGLKGRGQVVVIGATNIVDSIDSALRRPGRFDREIEIGVPDRIGRNDIMEIHTRGMPINTDLKTLRISMEKKEVVEKIKANLGNADADQISKLILDSKSNKNQDSKSYAIEHIKEIMIHQNKISLPDHLNHRIFGNIAGDIYSFGISKSETEDLELAVSKRLKTYEDNRILKIIDEAVKKIIVNNIANVTHGFTGADLAMLCKEAAMKALRRILPEIIKEKGAIPEELPSEVFDKLEVTLDDFMNALREIEPSGMRDAFIEVPRIKWDDIGGLKDVKKNLQEVVEWPLKHPEAFKRLGIEPPKGVLLHGPPGTGKTMLAKAVANEASANFIAIKGPEIFSKWVGESERAIRKIFKKARTVAPAIIFFDELDAIASGRSGSDNSRVTESVLNQILSEMDGIENMTGVVVLAATNRPDLLDAALLRPGRFDRQVYVPLPDKAARLAIFQVHTSGMSLDDNIDLNEMVKRTDGYSGADIAAVCREAAINALREDINIEKISMKYFYQSLEDVKPSLNDEQKKFYEKLKNK